MKKIIIIGIISILSISIVQAQWGLFEGIISTNTIKSITNNSAVSGGKIVLTINDASVTQKGIVWSKSPNPTVSSHLGITNEGANPLTGDSLTYTSNLTNLELNTTYYVRAYMINAEGTFYGQQRTFTTIPTLGEWGLIGLIALTGLIGVIFIYRRFI